MSDGKKTGNPIESRSEVVVVSLFRHSGMQSHADFESKFFSYSCPDLMEVLLGNKSGYEGLGSGGKGSTEGVSDSLEYCSLIGLDSSAQKRIMPCQSRSHGIGLFFPQARAALD